MKLSHFVAIGLAVLAALPGRAQGQARATPVQPSAAPAPALRAITLPEEELATPAASFDPTAKVYGFADASFAQDFMSAQSQWFSRTDSMPNRFSRFLVGNLNLYLDAKPGPKFRSLVEVRFTYLPAGASTTSVGRDYASTTIPIQYGSTIIERAWVEYQAFELLTLRMGQFLTPYSQWNVDHGSPALVGPKSPPPVQYSLFPDKQVGLELYGRTYVGSIRLGYHLTLSNGRIESNAPYMNPSGKFAVGGRVFLESSWFGDFRLGVTGYMGRFRNNNNLDYNEFMMLGGTNPSLIKKQPVQYDEMAVAGDIKWEWKDLLLMAELLYQQMEYANGARPTYQLANPYILPSMAGQAIPDHPRAGGYVLAAYRLPLINIMPYVWFARVKDSSSPQDLYGIASGINWRLIPAVVLKAEYSLQWYPNAPAGAFYKDDPIKQLQVQVAWAF